MAATTAATRRSSSMSSLHISGDSKLRATVGGFFFFFGIFLSFSIKIFRETFQEKIFWRGNGKTLMRKSLEDNILRRGSIYIHQE